MGFDLNAVKAKLDEVIVAVAQENGASPEDVSLETGGDVYTYGG